MPAKRKSTPSQQEALYDKLIATIPDIERKGDANPYTSLNGNVRSIERNSTAVADSQYTRGFHCSARG